MNKLLAVLLAALTTLPGAAWAQAWPKQPVRVVVTYGPGSAPDQLARAVFDRVAKNTGQPFVIDNRAGASGMIGADQASKSAPDGQTLVFSASGPLALNALLYKKMPYDLQKDLKLVSYVGHSPTILVVSNGVAAANVNALLQEMARPGAKMSYASSGHGTMGHLSMAYLVSRARADVPHAPYAGSPQIVSALIAGDIHMAAMPPAAVLPHVRSGKIRAIATIGPERSPLLPEVPTLREQGIDFGAVGWYGVAVPSGVPQALVGQIHGEISRALKSPDVAERFKSQGVDIVDLGPAEFASRRAAELQLWEPIIRQNNIVLE